MTALTLVQCLFAVGGVAVAEENYRELIPDYFSFNAPTRIGACGEDFAVFDGGNVTVFSGDTRTSFETGVTSCDKLALSQDGVFLLTGLAEENPQILAFSKTGEGKPYVIPSDNVTDISATGGSLFTLASLTNVVSYSTATGAVTDSFVLPQLRFSTYLAAGDDVVYFRVYNNTVFKRENGAFSSPVEIGDVSHLTVVGGTLLYEKNGEIRVFGEAAPLLKSGAGDAGYASVTDFAAAGGTLYVLDGENLAVKVYSADGTYQKMIGSYGSNLKRLNAPVALAVKGGRVLVADSIRGSEFSPEGVRALNGRAVALPTDIAVTTDAVYLADNGTLYEYNSALVLSKDYAVGAFPCKYVAASPSGTVFASSGREIYAKKQGETSFKVALTAEKEVTGLNVGIGGNIVYVLSGARISAFTQSGEVIGVLDSAVPVSGFSVDYRGDVYVLSDQTKKIYKYERVLEGYSSPQSYDLPAAYGSFSDIALDENGSLYVVADHNVLIYPKTEFSVFIKEDGAFVDNVPAATPRFVCEVVKESAIAYVSPGNFEEITLVSKGTRMMCYAEVTYLGSSYVRVETEKGTVYIPVSDVTIFEEGAAPFKKARCLLPAIGSNIVGVDIYKEPSYLAIQKGETPLFSALGEEDLFDVLSVVAVDQNGKDVWGFYRVEFQGVQGYVRADEVVSPDDDPPPTPKTYDAQVKSDGLGKTVAVYKEASRDSEVVASLSDGTKIKLLEQIDQNKEFTMVLYEGEVCYVLSANLGQGGLSGGQVLAIVLTVVAAVGSVLTILILRANKKHKRE